MVRPPWKAIGASAIGAKHISDKKINQDWINWYPKRLQKYPVMMFLSDGHGSSQSYLSHIGARIAVETARDCFQSHPFFQNLSGKSREDIQASIADSLLPGIIQEWRKRVLLDYNRWLDQEILLDKQTNPFLIYGATLVAAVVFESWLILFQLGDGDILVVEEGALPYAPLPGDPELIANQTTSLCSEHAEDHFRYKVLPLIEGCYPRLLMLSTDGYANSFRDRQGFQLAAMDYLEIAEQDGWDEIRKNLPRWLEETSLRGSGDDISVGLLMHEVNCE